MQQREGSPAHNANRSPSISTFFISLRGVKQGRYLRVHSGIVHDPLRMASIKLYRLADLFQAQLAIVLLGNPVALTGGVFKFLAVHNLHCTPGVLDELLLLQNTSCQAHARPICA